jgi:hypothetical protein
VSVQRNHLFFAHSPCQLIFCCRKSFVGTFGEAVGMLSQARLLGKLSWLT